ncbi:hypothetical protein [Streptomyces sp. NPDC056464]|uniref:hypothetical protein n=1 Tax=Streptomyces sp. NPDC056464 TaxID=3345828 RepID=UPI0036C89D48
MTAVAGAALVTGCGGAALSAPAEVSSTTASPTPGGRQDVRADLEAAAEAAGVPTGLADLGSGASPRPGGTEKDRKLAALTARLSPWVVSWSHDGADSSSSSSGPDQSRQPLPVVLSELVARGWKMSGAAKEVPVGAGHVLHGHLRAVSGVIGLLSEARRARALLGTTGRLTDLAVAVDVPHNRIRGPEKAAVTVVEYGDFECRTAGRPSRSCGNYWVTSTTSATSGGTCRCRMWTPTRSCRRKHRKRPRGRGSSGRRTPSSSHGRTPSASRTCCGTRRNSVWIWHGSETTWSSAGVRGASPRTLIPRT